MIVRALAAADLPSLIDLQEAGAVVGMADVFPQDQYPFPREAILDRWSDEINDDSIGTYVAVDDDGLLWLAPACDDWAPIVDRHALSAVIDLEAGLDEGIPCRPNQVIYVYFPFKDDDVPTLIRLLAAPAAPASRPWAILGLLLLSVLVLWIASRAVRRMEISYGAET